MKIAIQAADLDHSRIDGTRVYLFQLLRWLGKITKTDRFTLFHRKQFSDSLAPPIFPNYIEKSCPFPFAWMQTRFVYELWREKPDVLFLPVQAIPWWVPRTTKVVVTIHDMAWKYFPRTFTFWQRLRLNLFLSLVVRRADHFIVVSEATRRDLIRFFPDIDKQKINVIYHGFDHEFFSIRLSSSELTERLHSYRLQPESYLLFVGALQPRKNLVRLIQAFEAAKPHCPDMRLVIAGESAWLSKEILLAVRNSIYVSDIVLTGKVSFEDVRALYQGAKVFVFPSLYEGFGLPLLEAFASGVPVITARNSSLAEIAAGAAVLVDAENVSQIASNIQWLWQDAKAREDLKARGGVRVQKFSWQRCAEETLNILHLAGADSFSSISQSVKK